MKLALAALVGLLASISAFAQTAKEKYELQERCGRRAAEVFKQDFGQNITTTGSGAQVIANYENHYNGRLNRCLIFEDSTTYLWDNGKHIVTRVLVIADVNENKALANFDPLKCKVQDKECHSEGEWRAMVKPLMEE